MKELGPLNRKGPITSLEEFRQVKNEWNEVYNNSVDKSIFTSYDYIYHWYKCFRKTGEIRIYFVKQEGQVIGFLPMVLKKKFIRELCGLSNDHCLYNSPLVLNKYEEVFKKNILKQIVFDCCGWDVLTYDFQYSFRRLSDFIGDVNIKESKLKYKQIKKTTYTVELNKSFNQYLNNDLNKQTKKNFKYYSNRFKKMKNSNFEYFRDEQALSTWDDFLDIEDSGWKGIQGTSVKKCSQEYQRYYSGLIRILSKQKALHMYFLKINNKRIAGVFGYIDNDIFNYAKTGYNEKYRELSPSNLLLLYIIEHILENYPGIKIFHMFPWDYGYKHRYSNCETSYAQTTLYGINKKGNIYFLLSKMKNKLVNAGIIR